MTFGFSPPSLRVLVFCVGIVVSPSLGCSTSLDSSRYPSDLRYLPRQDVILKDELKTPPLTLPSPGRLDDSIRLAVGRPENKDVALDPHEANQADRDEVRTALLEVFGTPAAPSVEPIGPEDVRGSSPGAEEKRAGAAENRKLFDGFFTANLTDFGVSADDVDRLTLDQATLRKGSSLYRLHCLHCHGLNGDGRGPTGPWVNPHPRDYRRGQFKFVSTTVEINHRRPRRADLQRTLARGIDGTSMPAFGTLPDRELDALVSYVIHLSLRGQTEQDTLKTLLTNKSQIEGGSIRTELYKSAALYLVQWADANKRDPIKPGAYPYEGAEKAAIDGSVRSGHQLFLGKGGCMACHTDFGRQVPYRYDVWGTLVQPRNLTAGNFRGGRRPIDLYWRITGGIEPSGMSAGHKTLNEKERWDLVNFVERLPYPAMLPGDVRDKVYGPPQSPRTAGAHASR